MTQLTSRIPGLLFLSRFYLRLTKIPVIGTSFGKIFKMAEAYSLWNRMAHNFSRPKKNIDGDDVSPGDDMKIRKTLDKLSINRNSRLIIKLTGWPRIGYLLKVFPDAVFINVVRDGRAVAYSLLNSDFWWGRKGPEGWRLGSLTEEQNVLYEKHDKSLVALAGIYWNIIMNAVDKDIERFKPALINIKYEEFCENPMEIMNGVCEFCGLEMYDKFKKSVKKIKTKNMNYKWASELSAKDASILNDVTSKWCRQFGYIEKE
jgi:hypothetical protein